VVAATVGTWGGQSPLAPARSKTAVAVAAAVVASAIAACAVVGLVILNSRGKDPGSGRSSGVESQLDAPAPAATPVPVQSAAQVPPPQPSAVSVPAAERRLRRGFVLECSAGDPHSRAGTHPSRGRPAAAPPPAVTNATAKPKLDCDTPFTIDANGKRTFKKECFKK